MYRTFKLLHHFLRSLVEADAPVDPLMRMSPRELADLPVHHPPADRGLNP